MASGSPRTTWSGSIQCGLLNVPVTVGSAVTDSREKSLMDVCAKHHVPIDRSERCSSPEKCDLSEGKLKAVNVGEGKLHVFSEAEISAIEDATKSSVLEVLDAQPLGKLPILYGCKTYYVRAEKGAEKAMALLVASLEKCGFGLVTKLSNSSKQKLAVLHAHQEILFLTVIPMYADLRFPASKEKAHVGVSVDDTQVNMLVSLFEALRNDDGFEYESYEDEGATLRKAAVDRVIDGEAPPKIEPVVTKNADDTMAMLEASIEEMKAKA
jgi:non-homologous end joining protein Ku